MKLSLSVLAMAGLLVVGNASAATPEEAMKLAATNGCTGCHAIDKKTMKSLVGPAWVKIAKKYKDNPKAAEYLDNKIANGSKDVWKGDKDVISEMMATKQKVTPEDRKVLIEYILSLAK